MSSQLLSPRRWKSRRFGGAKAGDGELVFKGVSLITKALLFLVLMQNAQSQEASALSSDRELHFQSYESMRKHQQNFGFAECSIDFECQLVFAAQDWTTCFVETKDHATMLFCTPEHSNELRTLSAGARLAVSGKITRQSDFVQVSKLAVIDGTARLKPLDLSVVTHGAAARLNGLALFTGGVREVMVDFDVVYLFTWSGYVPYEVELHGAGIRETSAKAMWNQMVKVTGALTRIHQDQEALYSIRGMGKDQILAPNLDQAPVSLTRDFTTLHGQVQYTDHRSIVLVNIEDRIHRMRTRFAHRIHAGDLIEIDLPTPKSPPKVSDTIVPSVVIRRGNRELPRSMTVTSSDLRSGALASRVSIQAIVQQSRKLTRESCTLTLERDGITFSAVVPTNDDVVELQGYRPSDLVEVTGCAIFAADLISKEDEQSLPMTLYAASPTDLRFIRGPWRISPWIILYGASTVAGLLFLATLWNRILRREVSARTAELCVATTHLRKSYEAIPKAVLVHGEDHRISGTNGSFQQLFGKMPVDGENAFTILANLSDNFAAPAAFLQFLADARESASEPVTTRLNLSSPARIIDAFSSPIIDDSGIRYGRLWAFEDITDKLRIETKLLEAQKSEIVEQLSGGIAHDFNNLLAVIRSSLTVARIPNGQPDQAARGLEVAEMAVDQASDLTHRLLDFSRRTALTRRVCDVNVLLQHVYCLARHSVGHNIEVNLTILPEPVFISVDVNRIEQVLLNICLNARDSIQSNQGRISIFARPVKDSSGHPKVSLCVEDNGAGMPEEVRCRIYDAFFTTKQVGKGIGLGLAMARSVVEQLGGTIDCQSIVNSGTKFEIVLPVKLVSPVEVAEQNDSIQPVDTPSNILLVDDDSLVRKSGKAMLESLGHHVVTAESGEEALLVLNASSNFSAVILDYAMPGQNGVQVYCEIQRRHPTLPVAICSGSDVNFYAEFSESNTTPMPHFILKPFRYTDFAMFLERYQPSIEAK
jgi:signal transduction histidine kinase/CheY-like chemotaxis protein